MTVMQIVTNPDKLHRVAEHIDTDLPLEHVTPYESIAHDLIDTASHNLPTCIGLAAPQIGYNVRMFVMLNQAINDFITVINPEITIAKGGKIYLAEGCMSRPGVSVKKARRKKIRVRYTNEHGDIIECNFSGLHARIFQHEIDHLNGVLIDD